MNVLIEAATMDVKSTELEMKVADRTKNQVLIDNTKIDYEVAIKKLDALRNMLPIMDRVQTMLHPEDQHTLTQAALYYRNASQIKLDAAQNLDMVTGIVDGLGFMGLRTKIRKTLKNKSKSKKYKKHRSRRRYVC